MAIFTVCLMALSVVLAALAIATWRLNGRAVGGFPSKYRAIAARDDGLARRMDLRPRTFAAAIPFHKESSS